MADQATAKKLILVAEDDKFYANIYRVKLANEGHDVVVVGDGQQAVNEAKKRKPDLVLLDLIMPVMDGFEALKTLRALPGYADVTIMILSSLGQDEDERKAKELGASGYFVKTEISVSEMVQKVNQFLAKTKS